MALVIPITNERTCEGCTKCCDGWLIGEAYGHKFFEGKPCFWKGKKGCNIYDIRPYNPCVSFKCFWKYSDLVPKHFKPNNIGVIMVERFIEDIPYLNIHFGGQFVNNEVLDWCEKVYFLDEIKNIVCVTSKNILVYSKHSTIIKYFKENYSSKFLIIK